MTNQEKAEMFLLAKLTRTVNTLSGFEPNIERVKLVSQVLRDDTGTVIMVSGAFRAQNGWLVLPFSLTFSRGIRGHQVSGIRQMALAASVSHEHRIWTFLSIIECLAATGVLHEGSVGEHVLRISRNGILTGIKEHCGSYRAFCNRAAKDLPYDLSVEFLGAAEESA